MIKKMMKFTLKQSCILSASALLLSLLLASAVGADEASTAAVDTFSSLAANKLSDGESRSLLKQITQQSILPIFRELDENAQSLVTTTRQFCAEPDAAGLSSIRQSWSETLSSWQQSSPLLFGPATEESIDFAVYFHPVKKGVINGMLAKIKADSSLSIDTATIDQSGIGGQGLATVEYLLFDRKQSDTEILGTFTSAATGKQRCDYLVSVEALLASNIKTIVNGWEPENGNYAEAFYTAGEGSAYFTKAYEPMELLVNRLYQSIQAVELKQLSVPLGLNSSKAAKRTYPYKLTAWRSGHSLRNMQSVLLGVERLLVDGGLLETLDAKQHQALASQLQKQLKQLRTRKFKSDDLFNLLKELPEEVVEFHQQIRGLTDLVEKGLAPALGVQLGFNGNDGD